MENLRTVQLNDFSAGLDQRDRHLTDDQRVTFRALDNLLIEDTGSLVRRPRLREMDATIGTGVNPGIQAFFEDGAGFGLIRGVTNPGITGAEAGSFTTYVFDPPPGVASGALFEVLDVVVMAGAVCALIAHAVSGGTWATTGRTMDKLVWLHVWDDLYREGKHFSWVADAAVPCNFSNGFQTGNKSSADDSDNRYVADWKPRLKIVGSRLAIADCNGDVRLSKVGEPRVWNELEQADIETFGEITGWVKAASGTMTVDLHHPLADLVWDGSDADGSEAGTTAAGYRFWSYTLQVWDATAGYWAPVFEFKGGTAIGSMTENSFKIEDSGAGKARLTFKDTADTYARRIFRFKVIRKKHQVEPTFGTIATVDAGGKRWFQIPTAAFAAAKLWSQSVVMAGSGAAAAFFEIGVDPAVWTHGGVMRLTNRFPIETVTGQTSVKSNGASGSGSGSTYWATTASAYPNPQAFVQNSGAGWITGFDRYTSVILPILFNWTALPSESRVLDTIRLDQAWHDERFLYETRMAGATSSALIESSIHNPGVDAITCIATIRDYLLVQYQETTSLWYVPGDPDQIRHVNSIPYGSGPQSTSAPYFSEPAQVGPQTVMLRTQAGFAAFSLAGDASLSLADANMSDGLVELHERLRVLTAGYWPRLGVYVAMGKEPVVGGELVAYVARVNGKKLLSGWMRWTLAGITDSIAPDCNDGGLLTRFQPRGAIVARGDRLYFRHRTKVYYFEYNPNSPSYTDAIAASGPNGAFTVSLRTNPFRLGSPSLKALRYLALDTGDRIGNGGDPPFAIKLYPSLADETQSVQVIDLEGRMYDQRKVRVPLGFYSLAFEITIAGSSLPFRLREVELRLKPEAKWRG